MFTNDDIEISLDEYHFGIALEIENKSIDKVSEEIVNYRVEKISLNYNESYILSYENKYL